MFPPDQMSFNRPDSALFSSGLLARGALGNKHVTLILRRSWRKLLIFCSDLFANASPGTHPSRRELALAPQDEVYQ
jgi:hypothetical protein